MRVAHDGRGLNRSARLEPSLTQNILFICSQNRLRSPTAEQVFADWPGIETQSSGLGNDANNPMTPELLAWSDLIFVMEKVHRNKLSNKFGNHLKGKRIVCLDIPDNYDFMEPALVQLLTRKVKPFLPVTR
jgi:predicted protein tyrosine phosphatase